MQGALDVVTQSLVRTFILCKSDAIPVNNNNVVGIPVILKHNKFYFIATKLPFICN